MFDTEVLGIIWTNETIPFDCYVSDVLVPGIGRRKINQRNKSSYCNKEKNANSTLHIATK